MPNAANARVEEKKAVEYLLNPAHEFGGPKAKYFLARGFTVSKWRDFSAALVSHAIANPIVNTDESDIRVKYVIDCNISTPDKTDPCIRSVWVVPTGDVSPRLVTAYPR